MTELMKSSGSRPSTCLGLNNLEHLVISAVVLPEYEPSSWLQNALIDVQNQVVALIPDIRVLYCIYINIKWIQIKSGLKTTDLSSS